MGEVIRRTAAVNDILSDVRAASTGAQAAGGLFQTLAEQALRPALLLCELIDGKWRAAESRSEPLVAARAARNAVADQLVARISDALWNDVGRPANDPQYDLLFPGGITFYTDGPDEEQPARMELLAEMIESGLHPRLDAKTAKGYARQLRDEAAALETTVEAARKPRARAVMYERMRTAAIRSAQGALTSYKRLLKASNVSEARIHEIIPDRPSQAQPRTPAPPAPPSP